jgi:hypothetical protein
MYVASFFELVLKQQAQHCIPTDYNPTNIEFAITGINGRGLGKSSFVGCALQLI